MRVFRDIQHPFETPPRRHCLYCELIPHGSSHYKKSTLLITEDVENRFDHKKEAQMETFGATWRSVTTKWEAIQV